MIAIRGDIHGDIYELTLQCERFGFGKKDYIIITGDFGGVWHVADSDNRTTMQRFRQAENELNFLAKQDYTILFIDGNHENFDRLSKYPVKEWHGGKVHEIRHNVLHLMRGEIFNVEDKTFLAMGGARSHDIDDGILEITDVDKIRTYSKERKFFRINHLSWWADEIPSQEERNNCLKNIANANWKVDYILSHEMPSSDVILLGRRYHPDEYSKWLETLRQKVDYTNWFGGHYHVTKQLNDKDYILYRDMKCIR